MASRDYARLGVEEFGTKLIVSGDLDPVYIALVHADISPEERARWLVAYWCWYDCGVASWMAQHEGARFWYQMMRAACNAEEAPPGGRWARAPERRHNRGRAAVRCVTELRDQYPQPEAMVNYLMGPEQRGTSCKAVMARAKNHHLFGDWIAFKIADMLERVLEVQVDFSSAHVFMFRSPAQAAVMVWDALHGIRFDKDTRLSDQGVQEVVAYLLAHLPRIPAPPQKSGRLVGLQEVETVLCKWKSHMGGHYPLYNDIHEIHLGLMPWLEHSEIAKRFHEAMPKVPTE